MKRLPFRRLVLSNVCSINTRGRPKLRRLWDRMISSRPRGSYSRGRRSTCSWPMPRRSHARIRRLINQLACRQWIEFGCEKHGVVAGYAEYQQCTSIAEHRGANGVVQLIYVLVRETEMRREFARFGRSDANASVPKLWNSSTWAKNGTRLSGARALRPMATSCRCEMRSEPSKFAACSPTLPLARLAMRMRE